MKFKQIEIDALEWAIGTGHKFIDIVCVTETSDDYIELDEYDLNRLINDYKIFIQDGLEQINKIRS